MPFAASRALIAAPAPFADDALEDDEDDEDDDEEDEDDEDEESEVLILD